MAFGCHNCPHDAEIAKLREKCLACRRCGGDRVKIGNWSHVSLDAARDEASRTAMLARTPPDYRPGESSDSRVALPDEVLPSILRIMQMFTQLKDADMVLLAAMLRGERLTDFARRVGVSLSAVHSRWKRIVGRSPEWAAIATGMIGSGRGRKPGTAKKMARRRV